jgi:hypothetical protein
MHTKIFASSGVCTQGLSHIYLHERQVLYHFSHTSTTKIKFYRKIQHIKDIVLLFSVFSEIALHDKCIFKFVSAFPHFWGEGGGGDNGV